MAASALKIEANRANAQHSTGPRSEAGKTASARNSAKHNLTGGSAFVEGEDREEYDRHCASHFRQYQPLAEHEVFLIREVADASWRLQRARRMEAELFEKNANPFTADDDKDAIQLQRITRYISAIERTYYKAYNELKKINAERNKLSLRKHDMHGSYTHQPLSAWETMRATRDERMRQSQNEPNPPQVRQNNRL